MYEFSPAGPGQWTETTPHVFSGPPDGTDPYQNPLVDANGNL